MSVIIKGVDIPKNCSECPCCRHDSLDGIHMYKCNVKLIHFGEFDSWIFEKRPNWCPLRPLPEKHGRLIDAKVLDAAFTALRFNDDGTLRHWDDRKNWCLHGSEVESLIAEAPTIVEAEGE